MSPYEPIRAKITHNGAADARYELIHNLARQIFRGIDNQAELAPSAFLKSALFTGPEFFPALSTELSHHLEKNFPRYSHILIDACRSRFQSAHTSSDKQS